MQTIKQIADALGISKTAIRKRMTDEFKREHTKTTPAGVILVTPAGASLLSSWFAETVKARSPKFTEDTDNNSGGSREVFPEVSTLLSVIESQKITISGLITALHDAQALHASAVKLLEAPKKHRGPFAWFRRSSTED
jgi:hypothetical protein